MTVLTDPALESAPNAAISMDAARRAMIESQLRPSGVNDPAVLAAFNRVRREDHVPAAVRDVAYMDRALPLGGGRALAPPLSHGLMLSEAAPTPADRVLLVEGGSGYLAALLSSLAETIDIIAPGEAPKGKDYTLLLIDGAIEQLPQALRDSLAVDARVVTGLVERGVCRLATGRKTTGGVGFLALAEADFPRLTEYAVPAKWSF